MTYLITGGAGFIGANYIRWLLADQRKTRANNLDRLACPPARATIGELDEFPGHVSCKEISATRHWFDPWSRISTW